MHLASLRPQVLTRRSRRDPAIKVFIRQLENDQKIHGGEKFVLEDLGESGLFVKASAVEEIQVELDRYLDSLAHDKKTQTRDV